jgi:hypothetical protein
MLPIGPDAPTGAHRSTAADEELTQPVGQRAHAAGRAAAPVDSAGRADPDA